jgi:hypothetical protein
MKKCVLCQNWSFIYNISSFLSCYYIMSRFKNRYSQINMDTTAGGSGDDDGRGNYRFSTGKGKTQVSPQLKPKTQGGLERAMV